MFDRDVLEDEDFGIGGGHLADSRIGSETMVTGSALA